MSRAVNLVVDVQGYFGAPAPLGQTYAALGPDRKLDTRVAPLSMPSAGSVTKVNTGVAPGTTAVLVNLTMAGGIAPGYITADKCSSLQPGPQTKSSGNYPVGAAIANLAVVPVDADGSFCIFNQQPVHLIVDLQGAFSTTGSQLFYLTGPSRVIDTR